MGDIVVKVNDKEVHQMTIKDISALLGALQVTTVKASAYYFLNTMVFLQPPITIGFERAHNNNIRAAMLVQQVWCRRILIHCETVVRIYFYLVMFAEATRR